MNLKDLRADIHNNVLDLRQLQYILDNPVITRLWGESDTIQKEALRQWIKVRSKDGIISWIKNHPSASLEDKSTIDLKSIASKYRIPYWSRMNKIELIRAIEKVENDKRCNDNSDKKTP